VTAQPEAIFQNSTFRVPDQPGAIPPAHFQGAGYLRLPLLAGWYFASQLIEEIHQEEDVILSLLRFFGLGGGHQRSNALAVGREIEIPQAVDLSFKVLIGPHPRFVGHEGIALQGTMWVISFGFWDGPVVGVEPATVAVLMATTPIAVPLRMFWRREGDSVRDRLNAIGNLQIPHSAPTVDANIAMAPCPILPDRT
jgi:hypothetical protein